MANNLKTAFKLSKNKIFSYVKFCRKLPEICHGKQMIQISNYHLFSHYFFYQVKI